jgi:tryptophan-rich sensory protein
MSLWLISVIIVIRTFRSIKPEAAGLMMPVAAWLLFSLALNFVQWRLNGGGIGSIF